MTHHDAGIELRSINRLLKDDKGNRAHYRVPAYQRGYRWTKRQVTELLDDIWEFIQTSGEKPNSTFYCLQPIVVRAEADGSFEVVDGQQRLTTIYILLTCLKDMMAILRKESFRISFETRSTSETFLQNIDPSRADENVDFHHICEARLTIQNWLDARDGSHAFKFFQHLLSDDEVGKNVKVIWYQLAPQEDPVAAFTRLNVGKIPLMEAELVRALFLRSAQRDDPTGTLALRIAYEWDQVEQNLQDDAFWYFIQNVDAPDNNRIGILFRIAADIADGPVHPGDHRVFFHFSERLAARGTAEHAWLAIKRIHQALEEWYEDRALFHILGYLIRQDGSLRRLRELLSRAVVLRKSAFLLTLRRDVYKSLTNEVLPDLLTTVQQDIEDFCRRTSYANSTQVHRILLLFNLVTLLENDQSNIRFQFDSFKRGTWDIEHIRAVSDSRPDTRKAQVEWLVHCREYLLATGSDLDGDIARRIDAFIKPSPDATELLTFEVIDGQILARFGENTDKPKHDLSNLTLLDSGTNRGYKNAVFAVKRDILLRRDRAGIFVPLCTRNVFLKCYSTAVGDVMFWHDNDAAQYLHQICLTLTNFFVGNGEAAV